MYWDIQRKPSPYPWRRTTEHMKTSMGRMLLGSCTLPYRRRISTRAHAHRGPRYLAGCVCEAEGVAEVLLGDGAGQVDLVPEDQEGHLGQLLNPQQPLHSGPPGAQQAQRPGGGTSSSALDSARRGRSWASTRKTIPAASGK